ncbi:conserved exported hypothetical protein [Rhodococcus sp. RD6.2]|jgi:hypothetical protein|uniref:AMIN-like domain-containing (lipo)protein n=1 Tax=Rhodococcus sp. RD6.2 TaxID=260936 RepID=UPI00063B7F2B|nr:hypothetical protein [Rhodococcus sp. RD6.2]CRK49914.1 conserved exported hypothetical protein [Rhodococcus sp. RD6.2]
MSGRNLRLWTAITAAALLVPIGCGFDADGAVADPSTGVADPSTSVTDPSTTDPPTTDPTSSEPAPTTRTTSAPRTTTRKPTTLERPVLPTGLPVVANAFAAPSEAAALTVTDMRVESQAGMVRVVYVFAGTGAPGWNVRYVDSAVQDGSGNVLDLAGESVIEVSLTGTGYPFDTGVTPYAGPNPLPGTGVVSEVRLATVFEGVTQSFIGVETSPRPASVSMATDPVRVVVEIQP